MTDIERLKNTVTALDELLESPEIACSIGGIALDYSRSVARSQLVAALESERTRALPARTARRERVGKGRTRKVIVRDSRA